MSEPGEAQPPSTVWTVGHSTRTAADLIRLLADHGVGWVADVRTAPGSRRNPQFNREPLAATLAAAGIGYVHLPGLGGFRRSRAESPNTGWKNASFRGFADYLDTPAFAAALEELEGLARRERTALLCAEAVPWRCHRSLIADALTVRGWRVVHILGEGHCQEHHLTPFARVDGLHLTYPSGKER